MVRTATKLLLSQRANFIYYLHMLYWLGILILLICCTVLESGDHDRGQRVAQFIYSFFRRDNVITEFLMFLSDDKKQQIYLHKLHHLSSYLFTVNKQDRDEKNAHTIGVQRLCVLLQ